MSKLEDSKRADVYYNRGVLCAMRGDLIKAIADFDQALKFDSNCASAYGQRGAAWAMLGDKESAKADHERAAGLGSSR